jgi:hypothetical protein
LFEQRRLGHYKTKGEALAHTTALVAELSRSGRDVTAVPTLTEFLEQWADRFPRHPRTQQTNTERITRYILPLLPDDGDIPLDRIRRADLRTAQDALLCRRLAKRPRSTARSPRCLR